MCLLVCVCVCACVRLSGGVNAHMRARVHTAPAFTDVLARRSHFVFLFLLWECHCKQVQTHVCVCVLAVVPSPIYLITCARAPVNADMYRLPLTLFVHVFKLN